MKPYTPADPTPEEEVRMKELRQQCVIESYGPDEVRVDLTGVFAKAVCVFPDFGDINVGEWRFNSRNDDQITTPEILAAARARLMLSLVELDILERGIKAMEE